MGIKFVNLIWNVRKLQFFHPWNSHCSSGKINICCIDVCCECRNVGGGSGLRRGGVGGRGRIKCCPTDYRLETSISLEKMKLKFLFLGTTTIRINFSVELVKNSQVATVQSKCHSNICIYLRLLKCWLGMISSFVGCKMHMNYRWLEKVAMAVRPARSTPCTNGGGCWGFSRQSLPPIPSQFVLEYAKDGFIWSFFGVINVVNWTP